MLMVVNCTTRAQVFETDERCSTGERAERRRWRIQRGERVAAVAKIKDKRKPADFFGHRNRASKRKAFVR